MFRILISSFLLILRFFLLSRFISSFLLLTSFSPRAHTLCVYMCCSFNMFCHIHSLCMFTSTLSANNNKNISWNETLKWDLIREILRNFWRWKFEQFNLLTASKVAAVNVDCLFCSHLMVDNCFLWLLLRIYLYYDETNICFKYILCNLLN